MSKRIKPVFEDAVPASGTDEHTAPDISSSSSEVIEAPPPAKHVGPKSLTKEMIEKLEQFDSTVEQNSCLLKEKSSLEEKIAEYIDEIRDLREKNADSSKVAELEDENSALKKENSELQKSYDALLVRISELSFENAKLTCQLQELSSKHDAMKPVDAPKIGEAPKFTQPKVKPDPFNPYVNNGYSQWN